MDKKILAYRIRMYVILLAAGIGYYIWVRMTGIGIPCPLKFITGWSCPGCGVTTLFMRLFQGDVKGAFEANPFIFCTSPFIVFEIIYAEYRLIWKKKDNGRFFKANNIALVVYAGALVLFGVLRNII